MSLYFERPLLLYADKHPIVMLSSEIKFKDLIKLLEYCYTGVCLVPNKEIRNFLKIGRLLEIKGLLDYDDDVNSTDVDIPETPTAPHLAMASPKQQGNSSQQEATEPENIVIVNADVTTPTVPAEVLKKTIRPKRNKSLKIRLPPSQQLQVKHKIKRKALEPANENSQPKAKTNKAETSEKLQLACKFCQRIYLNKHSHHGHERECDENPNKAVVECSVCNKVMKVSCVRLVVLIYDLYNFPLSRQHCLATRRSTRNEHQSSLEAIKFHLKSIISL